MSDEDVIESFNDEWRDIVCPGGEWDHAQVMRELHDYGMLLDNVPKVYDHATNGRVSKPNTLASAVIGQIDEARDEDIERAIKREHSTNSHFITTVVTTAGRLTLTETLSPSRVLSHLSLRKKHEINSALEDSRRLRRGVGSGP